MQEHTISRLDSGNSEGRGPQIGLCEVLTKNYFEHWRPSIALLVTYQGKVFRLSGKEDLPSFLGLPYRELPYTHHTISEHAHRALEKLLGVRREVIGFDRTVHLGECDISRDTGRRLCNFVGVLLKNGHEVRTQKGHCPWAEVATLEALGAASGHQEVMKRVIANARRHRLLSEAI